MHSHKTSSGRSYLSYFVCIKMLDRQTDEMTLARATFVFLSFSRNTASGITDLSPYSSLKVSIWILNSMWSLLDIYHHSMIYLST
jgi:hypothetical protein